MLHRQQVFLGMLMTTALLLPARAQDEKKEWIHPEDAAQQKHFQIQGEYLFESKTDGETKVFGIQIIALSDHTFRGEVFSDGLPGAGWSRGKNQMGADGKMDGQYIVWTPDGSSEESRAKLVGGNLVFVDANDNQTGTLKKVHRESPTLGAKPPRDAVVLFDGSVNSTKNFHRGQLVLGNLLNHDCESKQKFGDHELHLEFRTPYMPFARGQGRGNSGMYLQGRYEVQVLDSFGLTGKNNECGGIYSIFDPKVNMCLPPLSWQTYDVDFTAARYEHNNGKKIKNARATIRHNGVIIHDNRELPQGTPGKNAEGDTPGILYLQGHGNPVVYRNIWVVKK